MGLSKINRNLLQSCLHAWAVPLIITAVSLILCVYGDAGRLLLRFDRALVATGELHRLIGGHFVHLSWSHALLNLLGLWLVWFLLGRALSNRQWLLVLLASIAAIDAGFLLFMPSLGWYVGLSGLLHGMLAAGICGIWRTRRIEGLVLAVLVAGKLAYEVLQGPVPGSEGIAGAAVITEAHLFGATGGLMAGLALFIRVRRKAPI